MGVMRAVRVRRGVAWAARANERARETERALGRAGAHAPLAHQVDPRVKGCLEAQDFPQVARNVGETAARMGGTLEDDSAGGARHVTGVSAARGQHARPIVERGEGGCVIQREVITSRITVLVVSSQTLVNAHELEAVGLVKFGQTDDDLRRRVEGAVHDAFWAGLKQEVLRVLEFVLEAGVLLVLDL